VKRVIPVAAAPAAAARASAGGPLLAAPPPLSVYIHFPWCVRKCPYCDFNSHEARGDIPEADYVAALLADCEAALPQIWGRRVHSVFIGGGTPSLLSVEGLDTLLAGLRTLLSIAPDAEVTLEANPGTVDADKFAGFHAAGVSRLSLGIQSFSDRHLQALGRIHTAAEARRAIELAMRQFENVNLDMMYALPEQSLAEAQADIAAAIDYAPTHLSAYHLTLEPNTAFHHAPPPLPDDDLSADMQEMVEDALAAVGYMHYETSAFARKMHGRDLRCAHNLNYWTFGDYLGLGAGAHGKLSSHAAIVREMRHKHPQAFLQAAARGEFVQERREVSAAELPFEFMMNALRLIEGFPAGLYEERTGRSLAGMQAQLLAAQREGLLEVTQQRIAPTRRGQRYLNRLLQSFLPDS
jgi:putative oxygen-independent coproporphyrinogen III oxidase